MSPYSTSDNDRGFFVEAQLHILQKSKISDGNLAYIHDLYAS